MRKTAVEDPEVAVPTQNKSLLQELDGLAGHFAKLSDWLVQAADELREPGVPLSQSLMAALSDAGREFVVLRERILGQAGRLRMRVQGESEASSSLQELRQLLLKVLTRAGQAVEEIEDREGIVRTLNRVLRLQHHDSSPFAPLTECQEKARRLLEEIAGLEESEPGAEAWRVLPGIQAFSRLLALVDAPENLSDDRWMDLQETVAQEFGRALTIAASRGKVTAPPRMPVPEPPQEEEAGREQLTSPFQDFIAQEAHTNGEAAGEKPLVTSAEVAPPVPEGLPSEVEQFLEGLMEEVSPARKMEESPSSRARPGSFESEPILSLPENAAPETSSPANTELPERESEPSAPAAGIAESSGRENLSDHHREQEKYSEEERLCYSSLEFAERRLGPEHPEIADLLANLALLYHKQGKYAEAEALHQRTLRIREKSFGPEHPKVSTSLNNMALLCRDQGKNAEAQKLWERSLAIVEKAFGPEHPKTALRVSNLADLFYTQGMYELSEQFYQRLVAILEKGCAGERPDVTGSLKNYLALLRGAHRQKEALQVQTRLQALYG